MLSKKDNIILYTYFFILGIILTNFYPLLILPFLIFTKKYPKFILFILFGFFVMFAKKQMLPDYEIEKIENGYIEGMVKKISFKNEDFRIIVFILSSSNKDIIGKKIIATIKGRESIKTININDKIKIEGTFSKNPQKPYPHFYDINLKNKYSGIVGYIKTKKYTILQTSNNNYKNKIQKNIIKKTKDFANKDASGLALALLIGERGLIDESTYKVFKNAGMAHILAISGLHMSIFCLFVFALTCKVLASTPIIYFYNIKPLGFLVGILFGFSYLYVSNFPVSGVRSFIMVCVLFLTLILNRGVFFYKGLFLACFIILFFNPQEALFPSFQLSFASVMALVFLLQNTKNSSIVLTSFAVFIITIPFVIHHFSYIHFYGMLSNILAIPILTFITMPSGLFMAFGGSAFIFEGSLILLIKIAQFFSNLPHSAIFMPHFNGYLLVLYFTGMMLFFTNFYKFLGLYIITFTYILYFLTIQKVSFIIEEGNAVINQGLFFVSIKNIDGSFKKSVWEEKINSKIFAYKNANTDIICEHGICYKEGVFTFLQKNIPPCICTGGLLIDITKEGYGKKFACKFKKNVSIIDIKNNNGVPIVL